MVQPRSRGMDGLGEDAFLELGFEGIGGHQVHRGSQQRLQFLLKAEVREEPSDPPFLEFHEQVDVTAGPGLAAGDGAEEGDGTQAIGFPEGREDPPDAPQDLVLLHLRPRLDKQYRISAPPPPC